MKRMNKVIAIIMMMVITIAMPAMAGNGKKNSHNDKKHGVVAVTNNKVAAPNNKKDARFQVDDRKAPRFDAHVKHAYHPEVRTCIVKVSRHDSHHKVANKVEHMKGVMDTKWNPRTRELVVTYDAKVTSARHILRLA